MTGKEMTPSKDKVSDEVKDTLLRWSERFVPWLVTALLTVGIWQVMEVRSGIDTLDAKVSTGQLEIIKLVTQQSYTDARVAEIRQNQMKIEDRLRDLEKRQ